MSLLNYFKRIEDPPPKVESTDKKRSLEDENTDVNKKIKTEISPVNIYYYLIIIEHYIQLF